MSMNGRQHDRWGFYYSRLLCGLSSPTPSRPGPSEPKSHLCRWWPSGTVYDLRRYRRPGPGRSPRGV